MIPLIASYYLLFTFLSWRRRMVALWILVAALPSYLIRFDVFGVPMTLLEGMILTLTAVTAVREMTNYKLQITNKSQILNSKPKTIWNFGHWNLFGIWDLGFGILAPIVLFLIAATISMFVAPDLRAAAGIWKAYFIEPVLFFIVFLTLVKTDKARTSIISALGVSALAVSTLAIYQHFTGFEIPAPWLPEATRRVTSFYGYPNAVGLYLAPIIALAIGELISKLQITKTKQITNHKDQTKQIFDHWNLNIGHCLVIGYWSLVILASIMAIIFSRTEGAWIAIPAGLLISGLIIKKYRRYAGIITILTIFIILIISPLRTYTLKQLSFRGDSGATRLSIWKESLAMLKDRPLLGAGLAGYQQAMIPYHKAKHIEIYLYPHNIFLNFWSETGLLGLIAFLWLVSVFVYRSYTTHRSYGETAALSALLIHGLVDVPYFKNDLAILFWILLALTISLCGQQAHPYSPPRQKLQG